METEFSVVSQLHNLKEVVIRLANEVESQKNSLAILTQQLPAILTHHMNESKQMWQEILEEVRSGRVLGQTHYESLTSKLVEGSKVYVIHGMESVAQSQSSAGHDKAASFESTKELSVEQTSSMYHQQQQDLESVQCQETETTTATATQISNEIYLAENLKLKQLVEAAAIHVAREKDMRGGREEETGRDPAQESSTPFSAPMNPDNPSATTLVDLKKGNVHNDMQFSSSTPADITNWKPSITTVAIAAVDTDTSKKLVHKAPLEKILYCAYCPRRFEHNHSIALHMRSCKKKYKESVRALAVQQEKCVSSNLKALTIVKQGEDSMKKNLTKGNVCVRRQIDKMIKCKFCERTFPTQHQVLSHERVHTGVQPYVCYICSIRFAHGGNMIKHIKSKHPKHNPYVCRHCNSNFKTHIDVQQHRKECAPSRKSLGSRNESSENRQRIRRESEETATASEDENNVQNHPPSPAAQSYPALTDVNHSQHDYNNTALPSILSIKQEIESEISHPVHNVFMANSMYSSTPVVENIASEVNIHTYEESGVNPAHEEVVNQFEMYEVKKEMELLPD